MSNIKNLIKYAMSDDDIRRFFKGKINIMRFKDLERCEHIDQVLGPYERCIILFEGPKANHWTLCQVVRQPNKKPYILFFDSYGLIIENEWNYIPKSFMHLSDQKRGTLINLLINQELPVHYNEFKLQKLGKLHGVSVNTCGRWCCLKALYNDISEKEFAQLMKSTSLKPDELVCVIFEELNK